MKIAKGLFSFFFINWKGKLFSISDGFSLPNMFLVNKNRKWSLKIKKIEKKIKSY